MKKIYFLGDSITEGAGSDGPETTYVTQVEKLTGLYCVNYGLGGTCIAKNRARFDWVTYNKDFVSRSIDMGNDPDYVFVFGGTNDYGHGDAPFGGIDNDDPYTFYGGLNVLISNLISRYGKNKICFILPLPRFNMSSPYGENKNVKSHTLNEYIEAMKRILDKYNLPYIDLSSIFKEPKDTSNSGLYFDGLHPNVAGHLEIAKSIATYLKKLSLY